MKTSSAVAALFWFTSMALGCSPQEQSPESPPEPPKALSAAALTKLAEADKADGKEDKLVEKCPACMLRMYGDAKHTSHLEGYTVHSCHVMCAEALEKDPEKLLARLP
ncbi:MAG: hypothetical protein CL940_09390 [Deltaproteobacteria bacterium]|nr:hypothetical protein [Deltaproteobacteria bacterium]